MQNKVHVVRANNKAALSDHVQDNCVSNHYKTTSHADVGTNQLHIARSVNDDFRSLFVENVTLFSKQRVIQMYISPLK
jgi:hypothetical protein